MGLKIRRSISALMAAIMTIMLCIGNASLTISFAADNRKIDVWDFGGVEESNTDLYNNHITPDTWNNSSDISSAGILVAGTTTFGDMSFSHNANDRIYAPLATKSAGSYGTSTTTKYSDGYNANGMWYVNGTGGPTRRNITIANVVAGDEIVVYMGSTNGNSTLHFLYTGEDGNVQDDTDSFTTTGAKYVFVAQYSGTYKLYTDASAGKAFFNRVERIPGVAVSGTIDTNSYNIAGGTVVFTNDTTNAKTTATLTSDNYTTILAPGYTYTATISGLAGYGFTNDTKKITPDISNVITGQSNMNLKVEQKKSYSYTGKITGFDNSADISNLSITMKPSVTSLEDDVELKINEDLTFSATLSPDVEYTAVISGVNDYEVTSAGTVNSNQNVNSDIGVTKKPVYTATGKFTDLPSDIEVTSIQFTNVDDSYTYAGVVTDNGYSASLRDGSYSVNAMVNGYKTSTHVVVKDDVVTKDLLFIPTDMTVEPVPWVSDIYVGYQDKQNNYSTINAAMKACAAMNPQSEAQRITVHIAPGTYREQIFVTAPYVSLVNDQQGQVLLTWYYGIGYSYYSADSTGYYNAENAFDHYDKLSAAKWGCSTRIQSTAKAFQAKNITFEASFNRYITDEEIEDGVAITGNTAASSITFERKYGVDVTSRAATERSAALAVEADQVEFENCSFLGGQDTLYTGATNNSSYYKNCKIEGNTDFIFGDGNAVFDGCDIQWKGYSDANPIGGYLTAAKDTATYGYYFRNCTVSANSDLNVTGGSFGRPWGAAAKVKFVNTKLTSANLIADAGWSDMSNNTAAKANFGEYNTTVADGTTEDISKRVTGVMDAVAASAIHVNNYFGSWTPTYYVQEDSSVSFAKDPYVTSNSDLNCPYPGNTITVQYALGGNNDANDASVIRWYRVEPKSGTKTLIKASTANADKTYKVTEADENYNIAVEVAPETISGQQAASKIYQIPEYVRVGYEDPSSGGDITLGDGVNIFLAGDSTVKDYSTVGMYMSGKSLATGSWGEYLQSFFDTKQVKVQNYANGGRSARSFINEGSLDKIAENIKTGDYLFIQFGHNDCANSAGYLQERFEPLGQPDANGIYPSIAGIKVTTPDTFLSKYGPTYYSYDGGGTYTWYLQQYIDVAKKAGAIPVLITPVSRQYYTNDGTIRPHHDSTDTTTGTQVTTNNAYVTAVKQLAEEQNVQLIDEFSMTKDIYEAAYKADSEASNGKSVYGTQVMADGDTTHSNKLGGFISAELMAKAIQNLNINISTAVKTPTQVLGQTPENQTVFSVNGKSQLTAYAEDVNRNFTVAATYWQEIGQNLITDIANYKTPVVEADADYSAVNSAINAAKALTASDYVDFSGVTAAVNAVQTGLKASDQAKVDGMAKAINDAVAALVKVTPAVKSTIWIIGDSTVSSFDDNYYYPRYGWGTQIGNYLDGTFDIQNLALSGRSSKSYTADPQYQTLLSGMKSGDYLLIGFGHNDEKADDTRYTNPNGTYTDMGSFANSLYENYIKEAEAVGCKVVLCTPIVRRTETGVWSDANLHKTTTTGNYAGGDYPQAIRDLGTALNIPVVDMTSLTKDLYDKLGLSETLYLHAWTSSNSSSVDDTHTNIWGGKYNAYLITKTIKELGVSGLAQHVIDESAPTKDATLIVNPAYEESSYSSDLPSSSLWKDIGIWKGSVFGDVGGNPSTVNQTLEQDSNGNMHIAVKNNKGKIANTVDGIAMYYYKVPATKSFSLSAKATINSFDMNNQVSFGLMARDEMYIDTNSKSLLGDYVAAGELNIASETVWNCFARKSGKLTQGGTAVNTIKPGDTVPLNITGTSDGYLCKFGNEETVTGGFDFKLTKVDPNYVYVGMYVDRNADITFSDIKLVVDGVEVTATPVVVPIDDSIVADNGQQITSDQVKAKLDTLGNGGTLIVDISKGSLGIISKEVLEEAATKNVAITIKGTDYTWEFPVIDSTVQNDFQSPEITIAANVQEMTDKLHNAAIKDENVLQLKFANSGMLPGKANVTFDINGKFADDTMLYLYYYNSKSGMFEPISGSTILVSGGKAQITLTYGSEYVLSTQILPDILVTGSTTGTDETTEDNTNSTIAENSGASPSTIADVSTDLTSVEQSDGTITSTSSVLTLDNQSVRLYVVLFVTSIMIFAGYSTKRTRKTMHQSKK